jgi:Co/Zn/Cd efflux system component
MVLGTVYLKLFGCGAFFVDDNLYMGSSFLHVLNDVLGSLEWELLKKLCGAFESNTPVFLIKSAIASMYLA